MSSSTELKKLRSELDRLLSKLMDQPLGRDEVLRLNELLRAHSALVSHYRNWMDLHADLLEHWSQVDCVDEGHVSANEPVVARTGRITMTPARIASVGIAVFLLLVVAAWYMEASRPVVAEITGHSGAQIKKQIGWFSFGVSENLTTGWYRLKTGLIQLRLDKGVTVSLQAPVEFALKNSSSVHLHAGKLSASVPAGAEGFTVYTDKVSVVDFGTEFAVSAGRAQDEVHVFSGRVDLYPATNAVASMSAPVHLETGEGVLLDAITCTPAMIDADRDSFLAAEIFENAKHGVALLPYVRAVNELQPTLWLRMEPSNGPARLIDSSELKQHGELFGSANSAFWSKGQCNSALTLGGPGSLEYGVIKKYRKPPSGKISGMVLVYAESRPRWASIAKNWAGGEVEGQFHLGLFEDRGDVEIQVQDRYGTLVRAGEGVPLPLHSWHHVAFTHDGKDLRLYRNGRQVASTPCDGQTLGDLAALCMGAKLNARGQELERRSWGLWHGRIDEFVLLDQVLSPDDIASLADLALRGQ